ncbi:hypothetical protein EVAR_70903_1 [Eumeta japonica]|uniref:Uncharacterized protein n=1 Tax=Eumeta variegata TaxID=151549 RepID=A0A4C1TN40_EUMVA|nr:hypothetical protein EVAR_70903_1 [Eumeta japonica]
MAKFAAALSFLLILAAFRPETSPSAVIAAKTKVKKLDPSDCLEEDEIESNKTYCTTLRKYPKAAHLNELIEQKLSNFASFFDEEDLPGAIEPRAGYEPNEEFRSKQATIVPQARALKVTNGFQL